MNNDHILAYCHSCGLTFPAIDPSAMGDGLSRVQMIDNAVGCPRCGSAAELQNYNRTEGYASYGRYNSAASQVAFTTFQILAAEAALKSKISRQQVRRFERALSSKGVEAAERVAAQISPQIAHAAEQATKTENPKGAMEWLLKCCQIIALLGAGAFSFSAGTNEVLDLVERLNDGKPTSEIVRELRSSEQQPAKGTQSTERGTGNRDHK